MARIITPARAPFPARQLAPAGQNEQIRRRDRRPGSAASLTARSVAIIHEYKRIYRWRV